MEMIKIGNKKQVFGLSMFKFIIYVVLIIAYQTTFLMLADRNYNPTP